MTVFSFFSQIIKQGKRMAPGVAWAAVSMLFVGLSCSGCKKNVAPVEAAPPVLEEVYTNRANNPAYMKDLRENRRLQMATAQTLREAVGEMQAFRDQVKAGLPDGTNETVLAQALATNAEWKVLQEKCDAARAADRKVLDAAGERVRQAILSEAHAIEAVSQGKAQAMDGVKKN